MRWNSYLPNVSSKEVSDGGQTGGENSSPIARKVFFSCNYLHKKKFPRVGDSSLFLRYIRVLDWFCMVQYSLFHLSLCPIISWKSFRGKITKPHKTVHGWSAADWPNFTPLCPKHQQLSIAHPDVNPTASACGAN